MTLMFSIKILHMESCNKIHLVFLLIDISKSYINLCNCFQVNASGYHQCYLWEDPICQRPGSSVAAAGLVHIYSDIGCLPIPVGDNAVDLLYHCAS